ncbi:MAG: LPS export ABC transporter periplasmic protein LptC [Bacteroidales bacterium]
MSLHAHSDMRPPPPPRRRPARAVHPVKGATHHRYSRMVRNLRLVLPAVAAILLGLVLPAVAAILLGLVVAWPHLTSTDDRFQLGLSNLSPSEVQNVSMVNARFYGLSRRNKPFTVTADVATEDEPGSGLFVLDQPKGDFTTASGKGIYVDARRGFYQQKLQVLDLEGEVNLYHEDGYELHTEKARVDLRTSDVVGTVPVQGLGPNGVIDGTGFRIREKGAKVEVTGRSKANLKGAGSK